MSMNCLHYSLTPTYSNMRKDRVSGLRQDEQKEACAMRRCRANRNAYIESFTHTRTHPYSITHVATHLKPHSLKIVTHFLLPLLPSLPHQLTHSLKYTHSRAHTRVLTRAHTLTHSLTDSINVPEDPTRREPGKGTTKRPGKI